MCTSKGCNNSEDTDSSHEEEVVNEDEEGTVDGAIFEDEGSDYDELMTRETFLTFLKMVRSELFWMSSNRQMKICRIDNYNLLRLNIFTHQIDMLLYTLV